MKTIKFLSKLIIFNLFIQGYSTEVKNPFLNSCELYLNESFYSPKTVFKEKDFSLSTLSTIYGIKLSLSFCDLRFYQKIKTLPISSINSFTEYFDFSSNLQSTVWSSTIDFENIFSSTMNKKIPLKFYAGSLSFSDSVTKLKNPNLFNSTNGFSPTCIFLDGIKISPASKTCNPKPVSYAITFEKPNYGFQACYSMDKNFYFSGNYKLSSKNLFKLYSIGCFSFFNLECSNFEKNTASSWRFDNPTFSSDTKIAGHFESLLSIPFFKSKLSFNLIENPFNKIRFIMSFEGIFHYSFFTCNFGFLSTDNILFNEKTPIFTTDGSLFNSIYQFKINPQVEYKSKTGLTFKTALALFCDFSIGDSYKNQFTTKKIDSTAEIKLSTKKDKLNTQYKISDILLSTSEHSASISYSHYFKNFSLTFKTKSSYFPFSKSDSSGKNHSLGIYLFLKKFPIKSISLSSSLSKKNSIISPTINLGILSNFNAKKVKFTSKIQIKQSLVVE